MAGVGASAAAATATAAAPATAAAAVRVANALPFGHGHRPVTLRYAETCSSTSASALWSRSRPGMSSDGISALASCTSCGHKLPIWAISCNDDNHAPRTGQAPQSTQARVSAWEHGRMRAVARGRVVRGKGGRARGEAAYERLEPVLLQIPASARAEGRAQPTPPRRVTAESSAAAQRGHTLRAELVGAVGARSGGRGTHCRTCITTSLSRNCLTVFTYWYAFKKSLRAPAASAGSAGRKSRATRPLTGPLPCSTA